MLQVKRVANLITVSLKLDSEKRPRTLGVIDTTTKIMTIHRDREKHLHLKSWSYGFNHYLLSNATKFDRILMIERFGTERHKYLIPVNVILAEGQFLHFLDAGFEKQIFLGLERIREFEK